jgi:hypothetical protein
MVSGETDLAAIGYGKSPDAPPQGKNGRKSRKIALPVMKRRTLQITE